METKKVALSTPIIVNGQELNEVEVRPTTIGDEENALQQAIKQKRGANNLTVELFHLARATRLPFDALRGMKTVDYVKIRAALNEVNGFEKPEEEPENPTMEKE